MQRERLWGTARHLSPEVGRAVPEPQQSQQVPRMGQGSIRLGVLHECGF